jgi:hypothetical protein
LFGGSAWVDPVNVAFGPAGEVGGSLWPCCLCRPPTSPPWARNGDLRSVTDMGRFYFEPCGPAISGASSSLNEEGGRRRFSRRRPGRFQRNEKHRSFIAPAASSALTWRAPARLAVEAPAGVEALGDQNLGDRARVGRRELPEPAVRGGPGVGAHWSAARILARRASASACDMDLERGASSESAT